MKKLIALVLFVAISAPAMAAQGNASGVCGPDGPEAYKRPGGYCEQVANNSSLSDRSAPKKWWWL